VVKVKRPTASKTKQQVGQLGLFRPDSQWVRPTELPDLRRHRIVCLDTENRDDGLGTGRGPGWALGPAGYLCGVAWAAEGSQGYAPVAHPETDNFDLDAVLRWVDDHRKAGVTFLFHNASYDVGWFGSYGIPHPERIEDTSCAAVMLDEQQREYNLNACCIREGLEGKDTAMLADAVEAYGGDRSNPQAHLWRVPAQYAGVYAETDAVRTLQLWNKLLPKLRADDIEAAYRIEMDLVEVVVAMRRRGIRVDLKEAEQIARRLRSRSRGILSEATRRLAWRRELTIGDFRSNEWLTTVFTQEQIRFPYTKSKRPQGSFTSDWMEKHPHWLPRMVSEAKSYEDAASKFVENFVLGYAHRGRLHAEVHQFLTDSGGTRSHRFSYSNPALQQMPRVDDKDEGGKEEWQFKGGVGAAIRGVFLPERGELWGSADYSQQEPRLTVHFAAILKLSGSAEAVERYLNDPRTDYHRMVSEMTGMPRDRAKILNLAMTYGKGKRATAEELGISLDEAEQLLKQYHERLPFIKPLDDKLRSLAAARGYVRLIDGARMRYNEWEGPYMTWEEKKAAEIEGHKLNPCPYAEALERQKNPRHPWSKGRLRRADTRKALNNEVQGSAARQTKKAMLDVFRAGVLPLIQMHDEIGYSSPNEETGRIVHDAMRDAYQLKVPVVVDNEFGRSWGTAKLSWAEAAEKYGVAA
jgi:DNA polymerase I-like protein with 3'-5' exonuclease and polymerase domains